ncbi:MAG: SprT family zinc-dependent metalloprotease [Pseudomonadota bacterium]
MILNLPLLRFQTHQLQESLVFHDGEKNYAVAVKRHARAKRLTLRVEPAQQILLTVPLRCSKKRMFAFLEESRTWLIKQLIKTPRALPFKNGAIVPLRGLPHIIMHHADTPRGMVHAREGEIHVYGDAKHLARRLTDFFKKEAKKDFEEAVARHATKIGARVKRIQLRDPRTRWGSCSEEGILCFSWRIIFAPPFVLDYLAAHEVAHLRVMDHSPRFWKLTEKICPHTPQGRSWLKDHGNALLAIGEET